MLNGFLRQSTASQARTIGPFVDDVDFKTLEDGLTIANTDIRLKKNGAADVAKNSGGGTADVNGKYAVTFDATDTDTVGELDVSVKVAGALVVTHKWIVLEEAVYDFLFAAGSTGALPAVGTGAIASTSFAAGAINAAAIADAAIDSATFAAGAINAAAIADAAIDSATFAAGAINAAAIANAAIDDATFASDVDLGVPIDIQFDSLPHGAQDRILLFRARATDSTDFTTLAFNSSGLTITLISDNEDPASLRTFTSAGGTIEDVSVLGTYQAPTNNTRVRLKTKTSNLVELHLHNDHREVSGSSVVYIKISGVSGMRDVDYRLYVDGADVTTMAADAADAAALMSTPIPEGYPPFSAGATTSATPEQILNFLYQLAVEAVKSSTTVSIKGRDGATEKATIALDDATNPQSRSRAT